MTTITSSKQQKRNLKELVQEMLETASTEYQDEHIAEDIYRMFRDQAALLLETEHLRTMLRSDPFDELSGAMTTKQIDQLCQKVQVIDYHREIQHTGDCTIRAVVQINKDTDCQVQQQARPQQKQLTDQQLIQLTFLYERSSSSADSFSSDRTASIWYSIDINRNDRQSERILLVQVMASSDMPSSGKPRNIAISKAYMAEEEESLVGNHKTSDPGDNGNDAENEVRRKRLLSDNLGYSGLRPPKTSRKDYYVATSHNVGRTQDEDEESSLAVSSADHCSANAAAASDKDVNNANGHLQNDSNGDVDHVNREDTTVDHFAASLNRDLLQQLVKYSGFRDDLDDATAFFWLMTFPYYENEWDLVGFVLSSEFELIESESEAESQSES